jgi:hypothetical protein
MFDCLESLSLAINKTNHEDHFPPPNPDKPELKSLNPQGAKDAKENKAFLFRI